MKVVIDADACPVKNETISTARSRGLAVLMVANSSQNLGRWTSKPGVEGVEVGHGRDAADFAIIERLEPDDVVVTQDTGLAAMVLGRGAKALSPRGRVFHLATIDAEMHIRHEEQKVRRGGGRTRGPSPFTEADRAHYLESLRSMLGIFD